MTLIQLLEDYKSAAAAARSIAAICREAEAMLEAKLAAVKKEWEESNAELLSESRARRDAEISAESALRSAMVEAFRESAQKQLAPGLSVRVNKRLEYDPDTALAWAKRHQLCLALDRKAFERIAAVERFDFVTIAETPVAVVSLKTEEDNA